MFIPIKIKYLAWVDLAFTAVNVVFLLLAGPLSFYWLMPLVPLANYFLFLGSDVQNPFPNSWRYRRRSSTTPVPMPRAPSPTPIGQRVTSRKPASAPTATNAPSAAEPTPTIRTLSSATARSATATTATAWTTSTTTSTSSNSAKAPQATAGLCITSEAARFLPSGGSRQTSP